MLFYFSYITYLWDYRQEAVFKIVTNMKARTMSLAHGRVMKTTFERLKGQYRHSPRGECQQSEKQPQTSISHHSPQSECQHSTSSIAKELHHSPMGE